jgi:hypothetical protein
MAQASVIQTQAGTLRRKGVTAANGRTMSPLARTEHRDGGAQNVAADPLQLIPPPRRHRHIRVQAEPFQASRAPSGRDRVGRRAETANRLPGARAEGQPALQRGGHGAREQRLLRCERVAPGLLVRPPTAADEEPP